MSEQRFSHELGTSIASNICDLISPFCHRLIVAGSLRRERPDVGDIEILFIPTIELQRDPQDFFKQVTVDLVERKIIELEALGILERRPNSLGHTSFGPKNKLMRHVASGIPVDFFTATPENWFNYLVCRTGPADLNRRICEAAQAKGWKWNPYGPGFTDGECQHSVTCEKDVFDFVGFPYAEPKDRR